MATDAQVVGGTLIAPDGGDLQVDPEKPMAYPGTLKQTRYGALFGPLEIIAHPDSVARVGGLQFGQVESFFDRLFDSGDDSLFGMTGGLGLLGAGVVAAPEDVDRESPTVTRRSFLQAAGATTLAAGASSSVAAQSETPTPTPTGPGASREKASFEAIANPGGLRVRVWDRTPGVLPPEPTYYTWVSGSNYGQLYAGVESDYGDVLPELVGTVTVGPDGAAGGFISELTSDKTQVYEGLSLPKPTDDAQTGAALTISDNDIIVEQAQTAGDEATTLELNGTSIPHAQEDKESAVGYYTVQNGTLIYRVGTDAPSAQSATLVLYADRTDELLDDVYREVTQ